MHALGALHTLKRPQPWDTERVCGFMFSQSWQVTDNEFHLLVDLLLPPYWFFRSSGGRCGKLPATPGL